MLTARTRHHAHSWGVPLRPHIPQRKVAHSPLLSPPPSPPRNPLLLHLPQRHVAHNVRARRLPRRRGIRAHHRNNAAGMGKRVAALLHSGLPRHTRHPSQPVEFNYCLPQVQELRIFQCRARAPVLFERRDGKLGARGKPPRDGRLVCFVESRGGCSGMRV